MIVENIITRKIQLIRIEEIEIDEHTSERCVFFFETIEVIRIKMYIDHGYSRLKFVHVWKSITKWRILTTFPRSIFHPLGSFDMIEAYFQRANLASEQRSARPIVDKYVSSSSLSPPPSPPINLISFSWMRCIYFSYAHGLFCTQKRVIGLPLKRFTPWSQRRRGRGKKSIFLLSEEGTRWLRVARTRDETFRFASKEIAIYLSRKFRVLMMILVCSPTLFLPDILRTRGEFSTNFRPKMFPRVR